MGFMSMPTPLKPKDKHSSLRIKMVKYLVLSSQNFKITFLRKLEVYLCHHDRSKGVQALGFYFFFFFPSFFLHYFYPFESKKKKYSICKELEYERIFLSVYNMSLYI